MKNIIITTFSRTYNKGANLQMYALKESLECIGADVKFLNIKLVEKLNLKGRIWQMINHFFATCFCVTKGIKFTRRYKSYEDLIMFPPVADAYIVGSDQVWNNLLTLKTDSRIFYNCHLPKDAVKYSYAASFGTANWVSTPYDSEIKDTVATYKKISVREDSALDLATEVFGIDDVRFDLDPTLLLSDESRDKLYKASHSKNHKYAYCYLLYKDSNLNEILTVIFDKLEKPVRGYSSKFMGKLKDICTIRGWIRNIAESDTIVTNSFHCLVFSILYGKNFIVVPSYPGRETRLLSLLRLIGKEDRYVASVEQAKTFCCSDIDYSEINKKLEPFRESSLNYLKNDILG